MRKRFANFMQGRYGIDQLTDFLLIAAVVFWLIGRMTRFPVVPIVFQMGYLLLIIYADMRILSRNHAKRYRENERFLMAFSKIRCRCQRMRNRLQDRKANRIFQCPSCRQKIRVPRGKGKIAITCPQCRTEFIRKS